MEPGTDVGTTGGAVDKTMGWGPRALAGSSLVSPKECVQ